MCCAILHSKVKTEDTLIDMRNYDVAILSGHSEYVLRFGQNASYSCVACLRQMRPFSGHVYAMRSVVRTIQYLLVYRCIQL